MYCIKACPLGTAAAEKFMMQNNGSIEAVFDMWDFVDDCLQNGCPYEKERLAYDRESDKSDK